MREGREELYERGRGGVGKWHAIRESVWRNRCLDLSPHPFSFSFHPFFQSGGVGLSDPIYHRRREKDERRYF